MLLRLIIACAACFNWTWAIDMDVNDLQSVQNAQNLVAQGLMDYYNGNSSGETPGMFTAPYYWWEAGVAWGTMLDYSYYTNNDTYDDLIKSSLLFQIGKQWNYMPENQTTTEGNDDQGFWGITVMDAAEKNFSNPGPAYPGWLYLAQAVFNTMAWRWDPSSCGGGLRWQIFPWNHGYDYKNSISAACMLHIGARLARYTGNTSYVEWCDKIWDWLVDVHFTNETYPGVLCSYDGANIDDNCSDVRNLEWTYNYGLLMAGSAYLYNMTGNTTYSDRVQLLWNRAGTVMFHQGIMFEAACQPTAGLCNTDERSFKGIFAKTLALTMLMAPNFTDQIMPKIVNSSIGAAQSCSGGTDGHTCGLNWFEGKWDGIYGLGEQICALGVFNALWIHTKPPPLTNRTGGTSTGAGDAGGNTSSNPASEIVEPLDITPGDRAGAGILTAVVVIGLLGSSFWMLI